jgi:hypothetical protein
MTRVARTGWQALRALVRGVGILAACLTATAASAASDPAATDGGRRALVAQKLKLVEQLLASPRARDIDAGADGEAKAALGRARAMLDEARKAADVSETERAEASANEALRLATTAGRSRGAAELADSAQRQRNTELREQIGVYRTALVAALAARRSEPRSSPLAALDRLVADAELAAANGRQGDANKSLAQAYQVAVAALSELRAGETVMIELKFDTPADEFAYEQKRHQSHEMLIEMIVAERKPAAGARALIEQEVARARDLRARAAERAGAADHRAAIGLMEEATGHLVRALQLAGMPAIR